MPYLGRVVTFAGLTALFAYLTIVGGTYGILLPSVRALSLIAASAVGVIWLLARWRGRWSWQRTVLDRPFVLWAVAIGLSMLLNPTLWRRELIGVWFAALYVGLWHVLSDLLARGVLRRVQLAQVVVLGSVVTLGLGYMQAWPWVTEQLPQMLTGAEPLELPRPGSSLGNPNTLAGILVVFVPLAVALGFGARGLLRGLVWALAAAGAAMMVLTYSRGGWLGLVAALLVVTALMLHDRGLLHTGNMRRWWDRQDRSVRAGLITTLLVGVLVVIGVLIASLVSLGHSGRSLDLRMFIYSAAVNLFAEQPIAGHGLFTFGQGLASQASTPPYQTHSHAHNMIMQVAAELGIVGLIALLATLLAVVSALRSNWQAAGRRDRLLLSGAYGAVAGFVVHHQFDFPAVVPVVAITGVIALVAACAPVGVNLPTSVRRARMSRAAVTALWIALIVGGGLGVWQYASYSDALNSGVAVDGDAATFRLGADSLQAVIDRDPALALYHYQQGMLYGLAAYYGDAGALVPGIRAFERYVALEPAYAMGWVNLSALQREAGDLAGAVASMRRAVAAAPDYWPYQHLLARLEELTGNRDNARAIMSYVVADQPDLVLLPGWTTPLRDEIIANVTLSPVARVALLLQDGNVSAARALFDEYELQGTGTDALAVEAWLLASERQFSASEALIETLREGATTPAAEAWWQFALAQLAHARDDDGGEVVLGWAREALVLEPLETDDVDLPNIHFIQYLHTALPRTYVPQVGFPSADPLLLYLLHEAP